MASDHTRRGVLRSRPNCDAAVARSRHDPDVSDEATFAAVFARSLQRVARAVDLDQQILLLVPQPPGFIGQPLQLVDETTLEHGDDLCWLIASLSYAIDLAVDLDFDVNRLIVELQKPNLWRS